MSRENWQTLVARYKPDDKRICNCRDAYETLHLAATRGCIKDGQYVDHWACASGCSAAQIAARDHVAACVLGMNGHGPGVTRP